MAWTTRRRPVGVELLRVRSQQILKTVVSSLVTRVCGVFDVYCQRTRGRTDGIFIFIYYSQRFRIDWL